VDFDTEVEAAGVLLVNLVVRGLAFDFDRSCGLEDAEVLRSGIVENYLVVELNSGSAVKSYAVV
jgi:hypothetical protein